MVVKRGGPVHISKVLPKVVGAPCPVCGRIPSVTGTARDEGWVASCERGDHTIELFATTKARVIALWNRIAQHEVTAA